MGQVGPGGKTAERLTGSSAGQRGPGAPLPHARNFWNLPSSILIPHSLENTGSVHIKTCAGTSISTGSAWNTGSAKRRRGRGAAGGPARHCGHVQQCGVVAGQVALSSSLSLLFTK